MMNRLARYTLFCAVWLCAGTATAAFPHLMSFQGRLDDASGSPLADGDYSVTFRLYDDPDAGIMHWEETQLVTTAAGTFAVLLGAVDTVPSYVFFMDSSYLEIQPAGSDPVLPRTRLTMVPYAWHARDADLVGGMNPLELEESDEIDNKLGLHSLDPGSHHERTISASDLVIGTLSESRLPQGAIDSTEIENESIAADKLVDEPGIAHTYVSLKTLGISTTVIDSAVVTVPSGGYLMIIANGWFYKLHASGTGDSFASVSLSNSRTAADDTYSARFSVLSGSPSGHTISNFTVSRVMTVSAGQWKIFLVGTITGSLGSRVERVHLNTLFFPTAYGNIDLVK
jgi:hypothetical protein